MNTYTFSIDKIYNNLPVKSFLKKIGVSSNVLKILSSSLGLITINNKISITTSILHTDNVLRLTIPELEENNIPCVKGYIDIAYEDEYILILYKPTGIATIPSFCNYKNSLASFVSFYMQGKRKNFVYRAINRLDKDAEGFVVIALDSLIYNLLNNNIQKYYNAICVGNVHQQTICEPILTTKNTNNLNDITRKIDSKGKQSITHIVSSVYNKEKNLSLIKVYIETGRTHQIRLHLSSIGCPILSDSIYGNKIKNIPLQLFCNEIYLFHPILNKTIHLKRDSSLIWNKI